MLVSRDCNSTPVEKNMTFPKPKLISMKSRPEMGSGKLPVKLLK